MKLEKVIASATLITTLILAAPPANAQHGDRRQGGGRVSDLRGLGGERRFPHAANDLPLRRGSSGRRLHGVPLTVRPCDEPSRFGPRQPNGVCFSVYPDISASGGKSTGGVRLKVMPSDAEVYADDVYAGVVEAFNGDSQRLVLTSGRHRIDVRAPVHQPLQFDIDIQPGLTTTYHGTLPPASSTPLE